MKNITKKVDECLSIQERPGDGTSLKPRPAPLIKIIYSRADSPTLNDEQSDRLKPNDQSDENDNEISRK